MKTFLALLLAFSMVRSHAEEQSQFSVDYDILYDIEKTGETTITQKTIITNQVNDVVPTSYTFSGKQMQIYDIQALVNNKQADPEKEIKEEETTITVPIDKYSIGKGRQNTIQISYKTRDIAFLGGDIWNIYIPKIQIPSTTTLYNISVAIPEEFGPNIYFSPNPVLERTENGKTVYYLTRERFTTEGITASFGKYQNLNYKLIYQIENPTILSADYEITLPPNIEGVQEVSYQNLDPKPKSIKLDTDGNVIATYRIRPKKQMIIELSGSARISAKQIKPEFGRSINQIPKELVNKYTKSEKYWETDSEHVQELAKTLKDENQNTIQNAQKIYNYIINNLEYDFDALNNATVERKGAEFALTRKGKWTCMEYSDLFIATARAMGIPAREVNGYAFTSNEKDRPVSISIKGGDLLHSWAEFYDPFYGWIQVDPTWGSTSGIDYFTKLDTNHFAFVVKGTDSEYPVPAGAYRFNDNEKLVSVDYAENPNESVYEEKYETKKVFTLNFIKTLQGYKKYKITNTGSVFIKNEKYGIIPPFSTESVFLKD